MRYVVTPDVALRIAADRATTPASRTLLAPTLLRSQVLTALYAATRGGELSKEEARARLDYVRGLRIRHFGDRVLQRVAWELAEELDWGGTLDAEYLALTKLQGDALVTLDDGLAEAAAAIVVVASLDDVLHPVG